MEKPNAKHAIDIDQVRKDTPGCVNKIHFNNAGSSLPPTVVTKAVVEYITQEANNGGYETADLMEKELHDFYSVAAQLLNTHPKNIAFTSSATHAFMLALSAITLSPGDTVLIANDDYVSTQIVLLSWQKRFNIKVARVNSLSTGEIDLEHMQHMMEKHRPKVVSIAHVPSYTGLIQPVEQIGAMCRERGILYLVDACQSAGQIDLDVQRIRCDFLSITMRKFLRGPRGGGILYVGDYHLKTQQEPLFIDLCGADWVAPNSYKLKSQASHFELWERSQALLMGSKAAVAYALKIGLRNIMNRNHYLCALMRKKIEAINVKIADTGHPQSSIITVALPDKQERETQRFLRKKNINTSISSRKHAQINFRTKKIDWVLRISPHYFNTETEIDALVNALDEYNNS